MFVGIPSNKKHRQSKQREANQGFNRHFRLPLRKMYETSKKNECQNDKRQNKVQPGSPVNKTTDQGRNNGSGGQIVRNLSQTFPLDLC
ncbi:MAG: hypothetical protein IPL59_11445 [Candidatus Competibacteraceae bacterium]|nr:hypothetical protein [Candidatus Competibacteraceae bacterium]